MHWVVVTGASSGIGWAIVQVLTERGFGVFASVRKQADADRLTAAFGKDVVPLLFDVTDRAAVGNAVGTVRDRLDRQPLAGLVNNAGIGIGGPLLHIPLEQFRQQLEVNLTGVLSTTQAFAPLLIPVNRDTGKPGRVINMGSAGGRVAYPFMAPYHVSKFGLEGFNESLRRELMLYDVDSVLIAPANVDTPIWDKADDVDFSRYDGTDYAKPLNKFVKAMHATGDSGIAPERVAETVLHALTTPRPKVRYFVSGNPWQQFLLEHLPKRWVDKILARRLGIPH